MQANGVSWTNDFSDTLFVNIFHMGWTICVTIPTDTRRSIGYVLFCPSHFFVSGRFVQAIFFFQSQLDVWSISPGHCFVLGVWQSCPGQCFVPVTTRCFTGCVQAIVSSHSLLDVSSVCPGHYFVPVLTWRLIGLSRPLFRSSHYCFGVWSVCPGHSFVQVTILSFGRFVQSIVSLQSLLGVWSVVSCRTRFRNFRRSPRSKWWCFLRPRLMQKCSSESWPRADCKAGSHGWAATPSAWTHTPSKAWSMW